MTARNSQRKNVTLWLIRAEELVDIVDRISSSLGLTNVERDYENVWGWIDADSADGELHFNISRKHRQVQGDYEDRVRIDIAISNDRTENEVAASLAPRLADALDSEVHHGKVEYLGGNDFRYESRKVYAPPARGSETGGST